MNHNFKELKIWQKSKNLCLKVYQETKEFPNDERFGLTNQIRRCSVSVPSNIAEVCGRNTSKQLVQYLDMAMGSLTELETQLIISNEFNYLKSAIAIGMISEGNEIQKMLNAFRSKVEQSKV